MNKILHTEAFPLNNDGMVMVQESIKEGGGEDGVIIEDGRPILEGFVGGDD